MSDDPGGQDGQQKRACRPNFAEDVYGEKKESCEELPAEYSESALAQRRSASLLKLKQLKEVINTIPATTTDAVPPLEDLDGDHAIGCDLEFSYTDCDKLSNELAELYSYSEMDDALSGGVQQWREYSEKKEQCHLFSQLNRAQQRAIIQDLSGRCESAESDVRLAAAKCLLYLLQGAVLDFCDEDEEDVVKEGGEEKEKGDKEGEGSTDRGSGGHEWKCVLAGATNAYLCYETGVYQTLVSLLLTECDDKWEGGGGAGPIGGSDGRVSKASSHSHPHSRSASQADLAESQHRRSATLADNEAIRVVLAGIYHMIETIRRKELIEQIATGADRRSQLHATRLAFLEEIESPVEGRDEPLVMILFEMMPPFYLGTAPHYPIKKMLLVVWKILLAVLGGWEELRAEKDRLRSVAGLAPTEHTLSVAARMRASHINEDGTSAGITRRNTRPGMMSRQLATVDFSAEALLEAMGEDGAGGDETIKKDNEVSYEKSKEAVVVKDDRGGSYDETPHSGRLRSVSEWRTGDRTPTARSPTGHAPVKGLPWKSKVRQQEIDQFIDNEREKFLQYRLPGDASTLFGLPPPILASVETLKKHLYTSLSEVQVAREPAFNRYRFSQKEQIADTPCERLYRRMLPNLSQYVVALLKVLLAAAPSTKAKSDTLNILCDVLTPETDGLDVLSSSMSLDQSANTLEESIRVTIDVNRHKEIIVKAVSAILILLMKHWRINHPYQAEYLGQHLVYGNAIPLVLKFLDQNMTRYMQSRHELQPYNFPQCVLHYARNKDSWPVLSADNVEGEGAGLADTTAASYCQWRCAFSQINLLRVLNKLTKWKHARTMMLVVFKSAPMLKRSLRIRLAVFQVYVLKLLKMQARYLGKQWRKANMEIMTAIYSKLRHRLADDWAFANDTRTKSWDFQSEEADMKAAVERFHARRYAAEYPIFAIEVEEADLRGDNYLDQVDMREFEPTDNCVQSLLGRQQELGERFKKNYEAWMESEVVRRRIDWDMLLENSRGVADVA